MTDDNIIQQARDVLAKWRAAPGPSTWALGIDNTIDLGERGPWGIYVGPEFAPLIVGTAGNPDLLDALDKMLQWIGAFDDQYVTREFSHYAATIAAAIIAADQRMTP